MNKVVTINLNGTAFQLEENGYATLHAYLGDASVKLAGNPDRDEILADIEQAIGEKCRVFLNAHKTVILTREIEQIVAEMGSVDDGSPEAQDKPAGGGPTPAPQPAAAGHSKRLFRIREGAMIGGVCNGLAAYFQVDPTLVRLVFALLAIVTTGGWILVYFAMMIIFPSANTASDKAAAFGEPLTAKEFIRRAKAGYYEGVKSFTDGPARREWQHRFGNDFREWKRSFKRRHRSRWWHHDGDWSHPHPTIGAAILFPIIGLVTGLLGVATFLTMVSLIIDGTLFGHPLPDGLHPWMALVLLVIAYNVVLLPFRIAKGLFLYGTWAGRHYASVVFGPLHSLTWFALFAAGLWYASHHNAHVHTALSQITPAVETALHRLKDWWARQ